MTFYIEFMADTTDAAIYAIEQKDDLPRDVKTIAKTAINGVNTDLYSIYVKLQGHIDTTKPVYGYGGGSMNREVRPISKVVMPVINDDTPE